MRRLVTSALVVAAVVCAWSAPGRAGPSATRPAQAPRAADGWGQPVGGLMLRLGCDRAVYPWWQTPRLTLDVHNTGEGPAAVPGLHFVWGTDVWGSMWRPLSWAEPHPNVAPGKRISLPVRGVQRLEGLPPGRYRARVLHQRGSGRLAHQSNLLTFDILPRGISRPEQLAAFVKTCEVGGRKVEAGFVPFKTECVQGEPLVVSFLVRNPSEKKFSFGFGGDYRGTGRHERFKITAVNAAGEKPLADPKAGPGRRYWVGGGLLSLIEVAPGGMHIRHVALDQYRTFPGPGLYKITCKFAFGGRPPPGKPGGNVVETRFELRILPRTEANVRRVVAELVQRAGLTRGQRLRGTLEELCSFAREGAAAHLIAMAGKGDAGRRASALRALGRYKSEQAVAAGVKALGDADEAIRVAAAGALGAMKTPAAVDALLAAYPRARSGFAAQLLAAMGATRSQRVFGALVDGLHHKDASRRVAAAKGLGTFGGSEAVAVLKGCAMDDDLERREAVVHALIWPLKQPLQVEWLIPLIRSRKAASPSGPASLIRMHGGKLAIPALVACVDFENPSTHAFYNHEALYQLGIIKGAPKVQWHYDPNKEPVEAEIEGNRRTLADLKAWLANYEAAQNWEAPPDRFPSPARPTPPVRPVDFVAPPLAVAEKFLDYLRSARHGSSGLVKGGTGWYNPWKGRDASEVRVDRLLAGKDTAWAVTCFASQQRFKRRVAQVIGLSRDRFSPRWRVFKVKTVFNDRALAKFLAGRIKALPDGRPEAEMRLVRLHGTAPATAVKRLREALRKRGLADTDVQLGIEKPGALLRVTARPDVMRTVLDAIPPGPATRPS